MWTSKEYREMTWAGLGSFNNVLLLLLLLLVSTLFMPFSIWKRITGMFFSLLAPNGSEGDEIRAEKYVD